MKMVVLYVMTYFVILLMQADVLTYRGRIKVEREV